MANSRQLFLLLGLGLVLFVPHLGLFEPDLMEARNFTTAREIQISGDWLVPTMNEEPRLAKPPLPTWFTAFAGSIGGVHNEFVLRLPAVLAGLGLIFFLWLFARRFSSQQEFPLLAAGIAITSILVIQMSRTGTWDIFNNAFMIGALAVLWPSLRKGFSWGSALLAGLLMGASFLSKGPTAFYCLLAPFLLAYWVEFGFKSLLSTWRIWVVTGIVTLVASAIWPVFIYLQFPELSAATFAQEATAVTNRHTRSPFFYLNFPIYSGIWALLLLPALIWPFAKPRIAPNTNYRFLLVWTLGSLILMSLVPEKKERYLLPFYLPASLLTASYLSYLIAEIGKGLSTWDKRIYNLFSWLFILVCFLAPIGACIYFYQFGNDQWWWLLAASGLLPVAGTYLWQQYRKGHIREQFVGILITISLAVLVLLPLGPGLLYRNAQYRDLAEFRQQKDFMERPFYCLGGELNMRQIWDLGKPVHRLDFPNEKIPVDQLPVIIFSSGHPDFYNTIYHETYDIQYIDEFDFNPKRQSTRMFVSLFSKKGSTPAGSLVMETKVEQK